MRLWINVGTPPVFSHSAYCKCTAVNRRNEITGFMSDFRGWATTVWEGFYQAGNCLIDVCDEKAFIEALECGFPLYVKIPLYLGVVVSAAYAANHFKELFPSG